MTISSQFVVWFANSFRPVSHQRLLRFEPIACSRAPCSACDGLGCAASMSVADSQLRIAFHRSLELSDCQRSAPLRARPQCDASRPEHGRRGQIEVASRSSARFVPHEVRDASRPASASCRDCSVIHPRTVDDSRRRTVESLGYRRRGARVCRTTSMSRDSDGVGWLRRGSCSQRTGTPAAQILVASSRQLRAPVRGPHVNFAQISIDRSAETPSVSRSPHGARRPRPR
jgi:hypothetical protein